MKARPLLVDTNLLVLFVVGTANREYIGWHKRLRAFTADDYDTLFKVIAQAPSVLVTPNTLTETSNLAAQIGDPARSHILRVLGQIIDSAAECYVPSRTAASRTEYLRLGLTDAALLQASDEEVALLTVDHHLYLAALASGATAFNFNHLREQYL